MTKKPVAVKHKTRKHIKVTHAHKRPYRKRHYALLFASLALGIVLLSLVLVYTNSEYVSRQLAAQSISDLFGRNQKVADTAFASTYGFSLSYDQDRYYASAVNVTNGDLYVGNELATPRAYNALRLSDQRITTDDSSTFKLTYAQGEKVSATDLKAVENRINEVKADQAAMKLVSSKTVSINGVAFLRSEWNRQAGQGGVTIGVRFVTYSAVVNGSPLTVVASSDAVDRIMASFKKSTRSEVAVVAPQATTRYRSSLSMIDKVLNVGVASAESPSYTAAERVSATYGPAVVKVYNLEVGDLTIDGQPVLRDHVAGGTGSGFIISADGYIATNGHVAVIDAREEIVKYAIQSLIAGNSKPIADLIVVSGVTQSQVAGKSEEDILKTIITKLYELPAGRFKFENAKQNLLIGLGEKQVDTKQLLAKTLARQAYPTETSIKPAALKSADFEGVILPSVTKSFDKSDVALLKVGGTNYPVVKLGDIKSVAQGGNLNIMGFPGIGSNNGLVNETKTVATLTTGKVSSLKQDTGGRSLIETDTEIGHGNSGGPAFNDSGEAIGIATYTVDGNNGDGVLNYVRDVADVKKLGDAAYVDYSPSQTQTIWNKAINQFYTARYKKAVANFAKVKELYPENSRVDELTAVAEKRIANGENVDDFPVAIVAALSLVVLLGIGVSMFFIVRHKKAHNALVQGVMAGAVQPPQPGMPPQMIPTAVPANQALQGQPYQSQPTDQYDAIPTQQQPWQPAPQPQPYQPPANQPVSQPQFGQPQSPIPQPPVPPRPQSQQPSDGTMYIHPDDTQSNR